MDMVQNERDERKILRLVWEKIIMFFQHKNIQVNTGFSSFIKFIRTNLDDFKQDKISKAKFIEAMESCFEDNSPLAYWDDWVLIRGVAEENKDE